MPPNEAIVMNQRPGKDEERLESERMYMPTPEQYMRSLGENGVDQLAERRHQGAKPMQERRRVRWGRVVGWFVASVVLAVVVYAGYCIATVAKISTKPLDLSGLGGDSNGRTNVLVLGVGDPGHAGQDLSDTVMMLSLSSSEKRVAQISVPRDLRVSIPGNGKGKINEANADGGPALAEQTVANTLGVPVNYYVKTDFTGLKEIVDAVGGIDVDVKQELSDPEYPCDYDQYKSCGLDIKPGEQHMDGTVALEYVRCRKGTCGNDFGRAARQQEVINLVRQKVVSPGVIFEPWKMVKIVNAVRANVQTDMGAVQLAEFALGWQGASKNNPANLVLSTAPGGYLVNAGDGSSDLLPSAGDFGPIQQAVQGIFR